MTHTSFLLCLAVFAAAGCATDCPPKEASAEKAEKAEQVVAKKPAKSREKVPAEASVHGKYSKLLRKIEVPDDVKTYGEVNDWGWWGGTSWAGHDGLPPGYWVYLSPNWYIWAKDKTQPHGPTPRFYSPIGGPVWWPWPGTWPPVSSPADWPMPKPIGR